MQFAGSSNNPPILIICIFEPIVKPASTPTATATEKELEIELDGVALIWPNGTVQTVRTDLSKVKRQNIDNIRIWHLKDGNERRLLDDDSALFSGMGTPGNPKKI